MTKERLREIKEPMVPPLDYIYFKHPQYQDFDTSNVLLSLATYDTKKYEEQGMPSERAGVDYGTALIACGIVAGNVWDGWLSETKDGKRLEMQKDDILTGRAYYFHHPRGPDYPVVPSFLEWVFPHNNLPPDWSRLLDANRIILRAASNTSVSVIQRDGSCRLSGEFDNLECAHIVPKRSIDWFKRNGMRRYNPNKNLMLEAIINDPANTFALREDIHTCFDTAAFAIVPKLGFWVSYFILLTCNKGNAYHNTKMTLAPEIPGEFLFARFAWAILNQVKDFIQYGPERLVLCRVPSENDGQDAKIETKKFDTKTLKDKFYPQQSRQNSPTKRSRRNSHTSPSIVDAFPLSDNDCDVESTAVATIQALKEGTYAWQKLEQEAAKRRWDEDEVCCGDEQEAIDEMAKRQKRVYSWVSDGASRGQDSSYASQEHDLLSLH
ncbi:MAG: hypothetical protein Q9217_006625 [Psora testacea]